MFPEIRSSPKTNKKLNRAIRRVKVNRQYYGNLKQRAVTQGQTVRQMLNKTKRGESTCPLDDQTSTDLMTIDHDREPEFNQQDDSATTNNTDLEANTPVEANKTAGANFTVIAEIHQESHDTDNTIYEATPIQDLDAEPTDEISTVPTDEISTVPSDDISSDEEMEKKLIHYCQHF
ncbi:uncharacterized protein LOC127717238 [Mytilus californianus]|uniref:uncharacterized protein LOC127717238 n=1 Tax=Mytilus californianus TaxID=6549 RepID=UPI00224680BD|nr:uncharacterized protein LOC127717238 [Mytilus californianus]